MGEEEKGRKPGAATSPFRKLIACNGRPRSIAWVQFRKNLLLRFIQLMYATHRLQETHDQITTSLTMADSSPEAETKMLNLCRPVKRYRLALTVVGFENGTAWN